MVGWHINSMDMSLSKFWEIVKDRGALASLIAQLVKNPPEMQETPVRFLGQEDLLEKGWIGYPLEYSWASLVVQLVKNLPAMWEIWI